MKNIKNNLFSCCKFLLPLFLCCSAVAMEQPKKLTMTECLKNNPDEDKIEPGRPFKVSLRKCFMFALQSVDKEILKDYEAVFNPSGVAIQKYSDFEDKHYPKAYCESCQYGLTCKYLGSSCKFRHYILGAFHSTEKDALEGIYNNGYKASGDTCSMGSGVYFTASMNDNNKGAFIKSKEYGEYVIINLVVVHRGIHKPGEVFTASAQEWKDQGADIKFIPPAVKVKNSSSTEYWGENVARYPEQVIPLGWLTKKPQQLNNNQADDEDEDEDDE